MSARSPKDAGGKGFSGLKGMISDVSTEARQTESAARPQPEARARGAETPAQGERDQHSTPSPASRREEPVVVVAPRSGGSSGKGWLIAIGIVIVILVVWSNSGTRGTPSYSTAPPSPPSPPASQREYRQPPSNTEEKPPVGTGHVLNASQIRYCLSEDIRVEAMRQSLNNYSERAVYAFNMAVNDYNSRCASFRYRAGALESVRRDVEARWAELQAQGIARARANQ